VTGTRAAYVGRFAPSPTGPLHLGSLVTALASFLDARAASGRWLVRMEDLDQARVVEGAAAHILETLTAFGLEWDGTVQYQSARAARYADALAQLTRQGLTFHCSCSRRELADIAGYPGTCRAAPARPGPAAVRFRVAEGRVTFTDRVQGLQEFALAERGDVVVQRRDGEFAYQLAVVVDDAAQGVTDVVRGADLMDSTPWQIALQQSLGLPTPRYAHVPLVTEPGGEKLAKSRRSVAILADDAAQYLVTALALLGQTPPRGLAGGSSREVLDWGIAHWDPGRLAGLASLPAPA
jgi:glutamyl-Q tRNA(Asp) synthetase